MKNAKIGAAICKAGLFETASVRTDADGNAVSYLTPRTVKVSATPAP
ncbi:hypothetical protein GCM10011371_12300 [Novosphingobium marinum]|uniref:Uncharacterized protein n=1 Tax=Novosphingobium marinum TaxID=1514948 RepID=A0A7Y9XVG9_9SPHN|nr:hypothetical protein [Novosphingobium marinum]NYH95339.1 hypothetical protein [Novosphingobium marinum]GGC26277.1 hypothetical protein GCM10011371_12300 [Novosphingobium marinum]